MVEDFFKDSTPCIMERLGRFYNRDDEYRQALKTESEIAEKIENTLSKEHMELVKKYQSAAAATMGVCELLAYRQGMRDMGAIIGIDNRTEDSGNEDN